MAEANSARQPGCRVAGSIGPLIASYRPDIHPTADIAIPLYAEFAQAIAPECDLLICETVVSVDHARSILSAAKTATTPVWLAVSVDDHDRPKLRSSFWLNYDCKDFTVARVNYENLEGVCMAVLI